MRIRTSFYARHRFLFGQLAAVAAAIGSASDGGQVFGQNPSTDVVRVEEDWELVVGEPDSGTNAPQVTCTVAPFGDINLGYAAFNLNHYSEPSYAAGGLQLQVWSPNVPLVFANSHDHGTLHHTGETVHWTQSMSLVGNVLTFAVENGTSDSWNAFGGNGQLLIAVATQVGNLNSYNPDVSASNSGIGYASHRVQSLVLKSVRRYSATGLLSEETTPRVVHPQP